MRTREALRSRKEALVKELEGLLKDDGTAVVSTFRCLCSYYYMYYIHSLGNTLIQATNKNDI